MSSPSSITVRGSRRWMLSMTTMGGFNPMIPCPNWCPFAPIKCAHPSSLASPPFPHFSAARAHAHNLTDPQGPTDSGDAPGKHPLPLRLFSALEVSPLSGALPWQDFGSFCALERRVHHQPELTVRRRISGEPFQPPSSTPSSATSPSTSSHHLEPVGNLAVPS
jgi:hypothetical protein